MLFLIVSCAPKGYSIVTDNQLCPKPPPDVFAAAGVELQVAKLGFDKISLEGGLYKSEPKVISTFTEVSRNEVIWNYLLCIEDLRKNYSSEQMAWFRRSREFTTKTNPNPEEYMKWEQQNPFPVTSGITSNSTQKNGNSFSSSGIQLEEWQYKTYSKCNTIDIIEVESDRIVKIESKKGRNEVFIISPRITGPGVYVFEGKVKGVNLIPQGWENYHRGKFQGVIFENGREVDWPDDDFLNTGGWVERYVKVHLDSEETVAFRVGLQKTKGIVYAKDLRIIKIE